MIPLGKQIQTSLRLISVSLSNVLYCIYDVSVVSRCTLYLNKILFTLKECEIYKHIFHFSATPPTNDTILNLNFLEFGTDIFEDFFMVIYTTQSCALVLK